MNETTRTITVNVDVAKASQQAKKKANDFHNQGKKGFIDRKTGKFYDTLEDFYKATQTEEK